MDPAHPKFAKLQSNNNNNNKDIPLVSLPHALPIHSYMDGHSHAVSAIAVDDNSTALLAASDKTLVHTDVVAQTVKRRFQGHTGRINAVAISDACETFLSASYDGTVRIWDGRSRSPEPIQILKDAKDSVTGVHTVQARQQGEAVIRSCSVDGRVRTYDLRRGQVQCDDVGNAIFSMALTHDGQCLAISCLDGTIRLMEVDTGELLNAYHSHHAAGNYALQCALSADDAHVVTGSEDGRCVYYDLVRGDMVQELVGHARPTCSIATHPKREHSSVCITASYDGNAIVWANDSSYIQWQE
jgi:mitogen-activated protein kinase organizer 1